MWFLINRLFKKTATGKAINLIKLIIVLPIVLLVFTVGLYTVLADSNPNKATETKQSDDYIEFTNRPKNISVLNGDDSSNGLNLLLISQLNDGYIKDYLTVLANNQNGQLNDKSKHIPLECIVALNMAEQGPYPDTILPSSYLPFRDSKVVWKEGSNGIPASAMVLDQANSNVFGGNSGHGPVSPYSGADDIANDPDNGGTASPYQIGLKWFSGMGKSSSNGYNSDSSRQPDITYLPDELNYLDGVRAKVLTNYIDDSQLKDNEAGPLSIVFFADGEGNICKWTFASAGSGTSNDKKSQRLAIWNEYSKSMDETDSSDAGKALISITDRPIDIPQKVATSMCIAAVESGGWLFENDSKLEYLRSNGLSAYQIIHSNASQSDFDSFIDSHKGDSGYQGNYLSRTSWCHIFLKSSAGVSVEDSISFSHLYMATKLGKYYYANLLKLGGLSNVDPTNPSTYMNTVKQSGQWTPSGNTDWYKDAGIDTSKLNEKRAKIINEGHKVLGNPYIWGGTTWPNQNADGTFDIKTGGMDCSGFTSNVYKRALGVDIGRDTYAQIASPLLEKIDPSEAKPGDLMFNDSVGHVLIYLSGDPTQGPIAMHDPQTGDVIKISKYHAVSKVYRLKGIDS